MHTYLRMYAFISYMSIWDTYIGRCLECLRCFTAGRKHMSFTFQSNGEGFNVQIFLKTTLLKEPLVIELDDGKIYRKTLYLMVKTMVSCKFSLKPIHWSWLIFVAVTTSQGEIGGSSIPQPRFQISREQIEDLEVHGAGGGDEGTKWVCVKNVRITTETIKFPYGWYWIYHRFPMNINILWCWQPKWSRVIDDGENWFALVRLTTVSLEFRFAAIWCS